MLSWSAEELPQRIDLRGLVDPTIESGIDGGRELAHVGAVVDQSEPNPAPVAAVASKLGPAEALKAASVAGAFEILNRIVDATGLPVGKRSREDLAWIVDAIGLGDFPHAAHDGDPVVGA